MVQRNWTKIAAAEYRNMKHAYRDTKDTFTDEWADLYKRTKR
jgi:hypothetical protein